MVLYIFSPLNRGHKKTVFIVWETVLVRISLWTCTLERAFPMRQPKKVFVGILLGYACALPSTEIHLWLHSLMLSNRKWVSPKHPQVKKGPLCLWCEGHSRTPLLQDGCLPSCFLALWRTPVAKRRLCLLYIKPMLFRLCSSNFNCLRAWRNILHQLII